MKAIVNHIISLSIVAVTLMSCSTTHYFTIETQQPAKLTFPIASPFVIVVNNAVPQPEQTGFTSYYSQLKENPQSSDSPKDYSLLGNNKQTYYQGKVVLDTIFTNIELNPHFTDSLLLISTTVVSKKIKAPQFFYDVVLYEGGLRTDNEWFKSKTISKEDVIDICEAIDADAIISIDKLLFLYNQQLDNLPYGEVRSISTTTSQITCSIYLKDREKALTSFSVNDTILNNLIFLKTEADSLFLHKTLPEYILNSAAVSIGEKLSDYFTPNWKVTQRIVYTAQNSRMKEALAFANKNKWAQAQEIWKEMFDSAKSLKDKARLANNIAVAYEMQDELSLSLEWIDKSNTLYKSNSSKISEDTEWITTYEGELKSRIQDNRLLDIQLGDDN